jgi:2-octaprenyl-6-methoxyphenol hydroxylase
MEKQKICIIGGSLTGLVTAIALSKLNCHIDLIAPRDVKNLKSNRTIAISEDNLDFLEKLNISKSLKKGLWPCSEMKLYTENKNNVFEEILELNNKKKQQQVLYMSENSKLFKFMINKVKKTKSIVLKKDEKVLEVVNSGLLKKVKTNRSYSTYNLVILCVGYNSHLVKNIFKNGTIQNSYKELAITTNLKHNLLKNNIARQIFLKNEILAMLPISNTKTSIVWSIKNNFKNKNEIFFKKKIKEYTKKYLGHINYTSNFEYRDLNYLIRNNYYSERTLLFGEALHVIHPFVGQGFNMTLRDLASLKIILKKRIGLGMDIGSSDILSEFSNEVRPRNFMFSAGVNILKNSISYNKIRDKLFKIVNRSNLTKNFFLKIANEGFKF